MKSPLAAAAGLLVLLARAPGSTVEAMLRARFVAAGCCWENFAAASAFKPVLPKFFGHLGVHFLLALFACYSGRWQCHHGGLKMFDALGRLASAALQAPDGLAAGQALLFVFLLELRTGEGVLDLVDFAHAACNPLGALFQLADLWPCVSVFALHAHGGLVCTNMLPLLVLVAVKGLDLQTASACGPRGQAFSVGHPVHLLAPKLLQQELRALRHASLEEPMLERAEDQAVVTAGDPACSHSAEGCVHPLVHREIQQHRAQGFSLAGMRRHGICRRERQLAALDLQDLFLALVVQVPRQLLRLDWIHTRFVDAVQLPSGAFELEVDD